MEIVKLISEHRYGIAISILIGLIFFLPHILMPALQDEGVKYMPLVVRNVAGRLVDEVLYAGYVHDVIEGNFLPRSTIFEWQDKGVPSHSGPLPAIVLGRLGVILGGLAPVYIISFFIFPFLGSLLVYFIAFRLTRHKKISYLAMPLLYFPITNLPMFISGFFSGRITRPIGYFSRFYPVMFNFVIFALALLCIVLMLQKKEWKYVFLSGLTGGLLFFTYFYYWTYYTAAAVIIILLNLTTMKKTPDKIEGGLKNKLRPHQNKSQIAFKNNDLFKFLIYFAVVASFGLLNFVLFTRHNLRGKDAVILRLAGAKYTHLPDLPYSLLLLGFLIFYIFYSYYTYKVSEQEQQDGTYHALPSAVRDHHNPIENSFFIITVLLSSLLVINIQVLTGYSLDHRQWLSAAVWPSIVLAVAHIMFLFSIRNRKESIKKVPVIIVILLLFFGASWQFSFAKNMYASYSLPEHQQRTFAWLTENTKPDEVVLTLSSDLILLMPLYTYNQNYIPSARGESISISEVIKRRLVAYRLLGVPADDFAFLNKPCASSRELLKKYLEDKDLEKLKKKAGVDEPEREFDYRAYEETFSSVITFESFFANNGCYMPEEFPEKVKDAYHDLPEDSEKLIPLFKLDYIIIGPYERQLMQADLSTFATVKYQDEDVTIYEVLEP